MHLLDQAGLTHLESTAYTTPTLPMCKNALATCALAGRNTMVLGLQVSKMGEARFTIVQPYQSCSISKSSGGSPNLGRY